MIPLKIVAFLDRDILDHLDWLAGALAKKSGREPSYSEAVRWLVKRDRKKRLVPAQEKRVDKGLVLQSRSV